MAQTNVPLSDQKDVRLAQIVAPIALYPDELLAKIFAVSVDKLSLLEGAYWLSQHTNTQPQEYPKLVATQSWSSALKDLLQYPSVINMMANDLPWTEALGVAVKQDQDALMRTVQALRVQANQAGYLYSNPEQKVDATASQISIVPTQSHTVYVPVYSVYQVYGAWPYPAYPPYTVAIRPASSVIAFYPMPIYYPPSFYFGFHWASGGIYYHPYGTSRPVYINQVNIWRPNVDLGPAYYRPPYAYERPQPYNTRPQPTSNTSYGQPSSRIEYRSGGATGAARIQSQPMTRPWYAR